VKKSGTQIQAWRLADQIASHAARALFDAAMASVDGRAAAPTEQEWQTAKDLRDLANGLFQAAMQTGKDAPRSGACDDHSGSSDSSWLPPRPRTAIGSHECC
jgi:hypothetical protein